METIELDTDLSLFKYDDLSPLPAEYCGLGERERTGRIAAAPEELGADVVLLDNMSPAETRRGVEALPEGVLAEASGGITVGNVPAYARTGVDVVSLGSLTHSAPALDCSFSTGAAECCSPEQQ